MQIKSDNKRVTKIVILNEDLNSTIFINFNILLFIIYNKKHYKIKKFVFIY